MAAGDRGLFSLAVLDVLAWGQASATLDRE